MIPGRAASARSQLFVAVDVPEQVRAGLAAGLDALHAGAPPEVRWTDPSGWHLTLAFLGETPPERVRDVQQATDLAAAGSAPLTVTLTGGAETFAGGALWAALEPAPSLVALAAALERLLTAAGFSLAQRVFTPHVTLARSREAAGVLPVLAARYRTRPARWVVEQLVVKCTQPRSSGTRHQALSAHPLRGRASPTPN